MFLNDGDGNLVVPETNDLADKVVDKAVELAEDEDHVMPVHVSISMDTSSEMCDYIQEGIENAGFGVGWAHWDDLNELEIGVFEEGTFANRETQSDEE